MLKNYLTQANLKFVAAFLLAGLTFGAILGNTVLLKYKSTALLRYSMFAADVKPLIEMTKDVRSLDKFINDQNLNTNAEPLRAAMQAAVRGNDKWIEPILRISKQDAKEYGVDTTKAEGEYEVVGLKITATARDPETALALTKLQTAYALQVQMKDGIESWVRETELSALGRLERYEASKLKTAHEVAEIQARLKEFRRVMALYPEASRLDTKPFLSLEKGSERYLPIPNQMSVMELRLVDIKEQLVRQEREQKKEALLLMLVKQIASSRLRETNSREWLVESTALVKSKLDTLTDERERIAAIETLNSFYELKQQYIDGIIYFLEPRLADRAEQPRPLIITALFGFLALLGSVLWIFKDALIALLKDNGDDKVLEK